MSLRLIEEAPPGVKRRLAQFRQVAREAARRGCTTPEETEAFLRFAVARIEEDDRALRSFQRTCRWSTYLAVVVHRLLVEFRSGTPDSAPQIPAPARLAPCLAPPELMPRGNGIRLFGFLGPFVRES
jgi:hypothetical protein